jgi:hypothetical protein
MSVKELLKIRFGPSFIEPVSRVGGGLPNLLGHRFVVRASFLQEGITGSWLWYRDIVLISESLELRVGPAMHASAQILNCFFKCIERVNTYLSKIQSFTLAHASSAFSSVSYQ